ncbi:phosphoribosyl-ATP diphosphatase [Qipengyuania vesicularis]|uniref:phosphoribosyl-ATP diphosphatase n=1 Tax=Qipengyuania vesicularis TaxID=2867232 RepID=UPI001C887D8D|nr:phosphoribosyl-ATP diphosphatase [Qipengyuania vesicularis]MBX7528598.1 phosphoribosyl-ATP diphosphatase [Qipengyuania vesicularis]
MDTLTRLQAVIDQRRKADPGTSYVAHLTHRGLPVMVRKFGEEAVETCVAALAQEREDFIAEAADTIFHLMIVMAAKGVSLEEVMAELDRREGTSGLEEKASRSEG